MGKVDAFQQISLHRGELTATERRVADAIVANPEAFLQSTTTMAAQNAGVSQSTVSRFCQKVGYESFADFRMNLMVSLSSNTPQQERDGGHDPADYLCDMLRATDSALKAGVLEGLAERIVSADKVFTSGGGLSAPPALTLSLGLLKYNVPCYYMECGQEMIHMHVAGAKDLVVLFSSKNDTHRMFLNVIDEMTPSRRPHTIMVSHSAAHPLRRLVDEFLVLPTWQTERYPVYIEPMTSMLAFCSLLMVCVSQKRGRDPEMLPPIVNGRRLGRTLG